MSDTPSSTDLETLRQIADEIEGSQGLLYMVPRGTRSLGIRKTAMVIAAIRAAAQSIPQCGEKVNPYYNEPSVWPDRTPPAEPAPSEPLTRACEECQSTGWCAAMGKCDRTGQPLQYPRDEPAPSAED